MKQLILLIMMSIAAGTVLFAQAPVDLSVCYGKGYTLNSTADAPPFGATSYTWYEDGDLLDGENEASLSIPAEKAVGTYAYWRVAANADCLDGVASNTFVVRVVPVPSVPSAPTQNGPKCAGTAITFSATLPGGATGLDWTGSVSGTGTSKTTATTAGTYSAQVRSYLTSGTTCYSGWSGTATGTINGPAGTNQAVGACSCASGLTVCGGYCRNLEADYYAVCYNNREIREVCVTDDYQTNCTGVPGFGVVAYSRAETQAILQLMWDTYGIGHIIWTNEYGTNASGKCRYVCTTNGNCNTCVSGVNQYNYGWFGAR
jgi:hypothetical protein